MTVALAEIRDTPLSVDEVLDCVRDPSAGGIALFVGVVRDHDRAHEVEPDVETDVEHGIERSLDHLVDHLDYSAHPQAGDTTRALAERLASDGRSVRLAVVHRVGRLEVGEIAVVVGVSAKHRGEAFEVCRELIDELKATVPIWKHQQFSDGQQEWVGLP